LDELRSQYGLSAGKTAAEELRALRADLRDLAGHELLGEGLHELLDFVQRRLITVTQALTADFFVLPADELSTQAQHIEPSSTA
jgi:uncharacterized alpha-E superfamily protein